MKRRRKNRWWASLGALFFAWMLEAGWWYITRPRFVRTLPRPSMAWTPPWTGGGDVM